MLKDKLYLHPIQSYLKSAQSIETISEALIHLVKTVIKNKIECKRFWEVMVKMPGISHHLL